MLEERCLGVFLFVIVLYWWYYDFVSFFLSLVFSYRTSTLMVDVTRIDGIFRICG